MYRKYLFFSMLITLIIASCGQASSSPTSPLPEATSAPPTSLTHTGEPLVSNEWANTSIQWVQGGIENKLFIDSGGDVDTEVLIAGTPPVEARRTGNCQAIPSPDGNTVADCDMQFRIDDSVLFAGSPTTLVRIEVEYFDQGTDSFFIQYDAGPGAPFGDGIINETDLFSKTDSGSFKTAVFILEDAYFANRINGGDFRIDGMDEGAEIIRSVKVTLLTEPTRTVDTADIIFYNGQVVTVDSEMTQVEAIAVKDDLILAVGSDEDILAFQGPATQMIDLDGRSLLPGFIEGHTHVLNGIGRSDVTLDEAITTALSYGLTTVNELTGDSGLIEDLQLAEREARLKLRVNVFVNYNYGWLEEGHTVLVGDPWFEEHTPILDHDLMLRVPGIKVFVDGVYDTRRGCWALTEPYPEDIPENLRELCFPNGTLYFTQEELNQIVAELQDLGFRVAFHTMGDRAIDVTLNAIEYALNGESNDLYRHAIQHNSLVRPDQILRYKEIGALASVRGYFNTCDQDFYISVLGPDRGEWVANRNALANLGIHAFAEGDFGWGTDHTAKTITPHLNPMLTLYGFVTHKQLQEDGITCDPDPWIARHVISIETALRMVTIDPAYAVSQEDYIGSLEPGKFADLIILSDNPLTVEPDDLLYIEVWMTMVGGQMEYCMPGHEDVCP